MGEFTPKEHTHKLYFATTKKEFEPVDPEKYGAEDLYKMKEYAIQMCNSPCNYVQKVEVKKVINYDE